ncbi:MAG: acyltransferase [Gemmatimonadaceae bacterium]
MSISRAEASAPARRIPSLDGLRAISILAVVAGHLAGTAGYPEVVSRLTRNQYIDLGGLGVRVFFIISGFLITGLLLEERRERGNISLTAFYARRTFRILPAYFMFVIAIVIATHLQLIQTTASDIWHAMTFTMNYAEGRSWSVGHLWSLAVEEQFYLLWPTTVALLPLARARKVALAAVLVVPVVRVALSMLFPEYRPLIGTSFETSADALALGCLLAFDQDRLWQNERYVRLARWPLIVAIFLVGIAFSVRYRPSILIGMSMVNLGFVLAIDRVVRLPEGRFGKVLNARPVVWIGVLSYSIYLWQQLFLNRDGAAQWNAFPLNVILAFAAAIASYYLVEKPALRQRKRFQRIKAPASP